MRGFFNRTRMCIGHDKLILDQIETDKLRKIYDDLRLYFALVRGPNSGPPEPHRLRGQKPVCAVEQPSAACPVPPGPRYMKVDDARKIMRLSEIFQWYESDFSTSGKTGAMYKNQFRKDGRILTWYTLECYPCNLDLEQPEVERCRNRGQQISPCRA